MNLRRHIWTARQEPAMSRNAVPCVQPAGQRNGVDSKGGATDWKVEVYSASEASRKKFLVPPLFVHWGVHVENKL